MENKITIINNFSSLKVSKKFENYQLLIWIVSLIQYKKLGYRLKLYCTENELQFLKDNYLYDFYDEIDTKCLTNNKMISKINETEFWSSRKIEAIHNEFIVNPNKFIYSDIDVIMYYKFEDLFDFNKIDSLFWENEDVIEFLGKYVYFPWDKISKPKDYIMPDFILNTDTAFNCGVMYFKNKEDFNFFYDEYYKFAVNNPCEVYVKSDHIRKNVFACNAEQRIVKACLIHLNKKIGLMVKNPLSYGLEPFGCHYFIKKIYWDKLINNEIDKQKDFDTYIGIYKEYYNTYMYLLNKVKKYDYNIFIYYKQLNYLEV